MENLSFTNQDVKAIFKPTIYVFRYMWLTKGDEKLKIRIIAGVTDEHEAFISAMKAEENVENLCRVYLHEIDVNLVEFYETLKGEQEENEN